MATRRIQKRAKSYAGANASIGEGGSVTNLCDGCKEPLVAYDTTHFGSMEGGYRDLCSRCFNGQVAALNNLDFEHIDFQPIELVDAAGVSRVFHFLVRLLGDRMAVDAFELRDGQRVGRGFQVIDEPGTDLFELMGRLVGRMRRAVGRIYLRESDVGLQIADMTVRGEIDWDPDAEGRRPLLLIDGREVSWDEFGRMLMTFEGFRFKLEIKDPSEEV